MLNYSVAELRMNLNHLDLKQGSDNFKGEVKLPKHFEEMKKLAEELSVGIPQVRADFYEIDNKVFFGELTFFDSSGLAKFSPESWDEKLGKLIVLPPPRPSENLDFLLFITVLRAYKAL